MQLKRFLGLNNVTDRLRAGFGDMTLADNIDITDTGAIESRAGYTQVLAATNITGAYATRDYARFLFVDNGTLKAFDGASAFTLQAGLASDPVQWDEVNGDVFFTNGTDSGIVTRDFGVLPLAWTAPTSPTVAVIPGSLPAGQYRVACTFVLADGRETGSSDPVHVELGDGYGLQMTNIPQTAGGTTNIYICPANSTAFQLFVNTAQTALNWTSGGVTSLGKELTNVGLFPAPPATALAIWRSRLVLGTHLPSEHASAIWMSKPLAYHLFDLERDFFMVPGQVLLLAPTPTGLIVGTDDCVYAYTPEGGLVVLAEYGCIAGSGWALHDGATLFWTARGLCRGLPFSNMTERRVSVAPGQSVGLNVMERNGAVRAVANLVRGGAAFNQRAS